MPPAVVAARPGTRGGDDVVGLAERQRRRRLATDPGALEEYYHELGPLVLAYLRRRVAAQDAEDVLQKVFLELWRSRQSYDVDKPMLPWMLGIAHKRAVDHLRRHSRRDEGPLDQVTETGKADSAQFTDLFVDAEAVRVALADLPDEQREALVLAYFGDLTQAQIAERLGVPLGTVKARSFRGLRRLAAHLIREENP